MSQHDTAHPLNSHKTRTKDYFFKLRACFCRAGWPGFCPVPPCCDSILSHTAGQSLLSRGFRVQWPWSEGCCHECKLPRRCFAGWKVKTKNHKLWFQQNVMKPAWKKKTSWNWEKFILLFLFFCIFVTASVCFSFTEGRMSRVRRCMCVAINRGDPLWWVMIWRLHHNKLQLIWC